MQIVPAIDLLEDSRIGPDDRSGNSARQPVQSGETINIRDQVVGDSGECGAGGDPYLWENGEIVALSDLILPGSDRIVFDAFQINDLGQIVSLCATPEGYVHVCLLMPVKNDTFAAVEPRHQAQQASAPSIELPPTGERHPTRLDRRPHGRTHLLRHPARNQ